MGSARRFSAVIVGEEPNAERVWKEVGMKKYYFSYRLKSGDTGEGKINVPNHHNIQTVLDFAAQYVIDEVSMFTRREEYLKEDFISEINIRGKHDRT